jgi:hypothetical protein
MTALLLDPISQQASPQQELRLIHILGVKQVYAAVLKTKNLVIASTKQPILI